MRSPAPAETCLRVRPFPFSLCPSLRPFLNQAQYGSAGDAVLVELDHLRFVGVSEEAVDLSHQVRSSPSTSRAFGNRLVYAMRTREVPGLLWAA